MREYKGKWIDLFEVYTITDKEFPNLYGKICLSTPDIDYIMDQNQFNEFKRKVNSI